MGKRRRLRAGADSQDCWLGFSLKNNLCPQGREMLISFTQMKMVVVPVKVKEQPFISLPTLCLAISFILNKVRLQLRKSMKNMFWHKNPIYI